MVGALSVSLHRANHEGLTRAAKSLGRQGFASASRFDWSGGSVRMWAWPAQAGVDDCNVRTPAGEAFCVGPLWYRGQFGRGALQSLLEDLSVAGSIDERELRGNFALFLHTARSCLLMNDAVGLVKIHASSDGLFYSTSWLASCAYVGQVELDEDAAIEYVLLGAAHSDQTVAQGVTTLPLGQAFELTTRRMHARFPEGWRTDSQRPATFDEAVGEIGEHLETVSREIATAFQGRVRTALSGGFDSRLILAGLMAAGHHPQLFVYGNAASADVIVARAVAKGLDMPLTVIDKSTINRQYELPDLQRLVDTALFFDGLPTDGIHDPGADQQTRLQQTAHGYLGLNGGGGEIFRNYFHLMDGSLRAKDVVRAFYRGFDSAVFRRKDGLARYEAGLAQSIRWAAGVGAATTRRRLTREEVELVYPLFRCHHWMAVNNSVGIRHGYYATPLIDLATVRLAARLPLAWKNAGRLESRLIARLHAGAARQMSEYGFSFNDGPNRHARLNELITCMRPVFLRPFISATRRRIARFGVAVDMVQHYRSLLPGEWRLDPALDLRRLPDPQAFARALAVEVACRGLP